MMSAGAATSRLAFLEFVQAARYEQGLSPDDVPDADEPSLTFTLKLEGIWFELEHVDDPASQVIDVLLARALLFKLADESSLAQEAVMREALYASRRTMHSLAGAFSISAEENELHFLTTFPIHAPAREALAVLRQVASTLAEWRNHARNAS
jgi:hypothetical protein